MIPVTFRPLVSWPEPTKDRRRAQFKASWSDTLDLLDRELHALGAKRCVIEAGFTERDIRADGWPRGNARAPEHPGVRLAFDSVRGPLIYATDVYGQSAWGSDLAPWQNNLRAIALGLEALRAVDRYGITRKGEQYTGFRALPAGQTGSAGAAPPPAMTKEDAARRLLDAARWEPGMLTIVLTDPDVRGTLWKAAARAAHPDTGGNPVMFADVTAAWAVLRA